MRVQVCRGKEEGGKNRRREGGKRTMDGSGIDCVLHGEQEAEGEGGGNNKCIRPSRKTMTTPSSILHFSKCQDENFMMREGRRPSVRVRPARWPQQLEVAPFRLTMGGRANS